MNLKCKSINNKIINEKRGYLDISFSWIFAIIIGGFILFGAIYGVSKFLNMEEARTSAESATEFSTLLNPLELGVESAKSIYIEMPLNSRVNSMCSTVGTFGTQGVSIDEYIRNSWTNSNIEIYSESKYMFSESTLEGERFYVFSKNFDYPYKVSSLMYLTSANDVYCFVDPPVKIERELEDLNQDNIKVGSECRSDISTDVCFGRTNCDITVGYQEKVVRKNGDIMYFDTDALMYGAIFSDSRVYECQVSRLMDRVRKLSEIYEEKALLIIKTGCISNALNDLGSLKVSLEDYSDSENLSMNTRTVKDMEVKNDGKCKLW